MTPFEQALAAYDAAVEHDRDTLGYTRAPALRTALVAMATRGADDARELANIPAVREALGRNHTRSCKCVLCRIDDAALAQPSDAPITCIGFANGCHCSGCMAQPSDAGKEIDYERGKEEDRDFGFDGW